MSNTVNIQQEMNAPDSFFKRTIYALFVDEVSKQVALEQLYQMWLQAANVQTLENFALYLERNAHKRPIEMPNLFKLYRQGYLKELDEVMTEYQAYQVVIQDIDLKLEELQQTLLQGMIALDKHLDNAFDLALQSKASPVPQFTPSLTPLPAPKPSHKQKLKAHIHQALKEAAHAHQQQQAAEYQAKVLKPELIKPQIDCGVVCQILRKKLQLNEQLRACYSSTVAHNQFVEHMLADNSSHLPFIHGLLINHHAMAHYNWQRQLMMNRLQELDHQLDSAHSRAPANVVAWPPRCEPNS